MRHRTSALVRRAPARPKQRRPVRRDGWPIDVAALWLKTTARPVWTVHAQGEKRRTKASHSGLTMVRQSGSGRVAMLLCATYFGLIASGGAMRAVAVLMSR